MRGPRIAHPIGFIPQFGIDIRDRLVYLSLSIVPF